MAGMTQPKFAGANGERCCRPPFEQLDLTERPENERRAGGVTVGALDVAGQAGDRREFPAPPLVDLELAGCQGGEVVSPARSRKAGLQRAETLAT